MRTAEVHLAARSLGTFKMSDFKGGAAIGGLLMTRSFRPSATRALYRIEPMPPREA